MSIQKLNGKDRVPTNVLLNGAIRYGVYDSNGTLLRYEYMKREDEPVEVGTDVNKVLWDKIDDNFTEELANRSRVDRYNLLTLDMEEDTLTTGNIIPTTGWAQVTAGTDYTNTYFGGALEIKASVADVSYGPVDAAFNGNTSYGWRGVFNIKSATITVDFGMQQKITKFKTYVASSTYGFQMVDSWKIEGSNDETNWTALYENGTQQEQLTEVTLTTTGFYRYYRFTFVADPTYDTSYIKVYEIEVSEYYTVKNVLKLNSTEISGYSAYSIRDVILVKTPSSINYNLDTYININNLGNKEVNNMDKTDEYYELTYNGTSFDAYSIRDEITTIKNDIEAIKQAIIDLGGVI